MLPQHFMAKRAIAILTTGVLIAAPTVIIGWFLLSSDLNKNQASDVGRILTVGTVSAIVAGLACAALFWKGLWHESWFTRVAASVASGFVICALSMFAILLVPNANGSSELGTAVMTSVMGAFFFLVVLGPMGLVIGLLLRPMLARLID